MGQAGDKNCEGFDLGDEIARHITPEMIEAGATAMSEFHYDYGSYESAVVEIFTEMVWAAPNKESLLKFLILHLGP